MKFKTNGLALVAILMLVSCVAHAAVKPHGIFVDHMVLQRERPIPVFGTAEAGESVTVEFGGQKLTNIADKDGNWSVMLKPLQASSEPAAMTPYPEGCNLYNKEGLPASPFKTDAW